MRLNRKLENERRYQGLAFGLQKKIIKNPFLSKMNSVPYKSSYPDDDYNYPNDNIIILQ